MAGGLINHIYRLIWQEPLVNITVRQLGCRNERVICYANTVMQFVFFFQSSEDKDRVLYAWLAHKHRLERRVRRHQPQHICGTHPVWSHQYNAACRGPEPVSTVLRHPLPRLFCRPDQLVHLINKDDDFAFCGVYFIRPPSAVLQAHLVILHQRPEPHIQTARFYLPSLRHIFVVDPCGRSNGCLADNKGINKTGLFLVRRANLGVRRTSSSRPITGSRLPCKARAVGSVAYFDRLSIISSPTSLSMVRPFRIPRYRGSAFRHLTRLHATAVRPWLLTGTQLLEVHPAQQSCLLVPLPNLLQEQDTTQMSIYLQIICATACDNRSLSSSSARPCFRLCRLVPARANNLPAICCSSSARLTTMQVGHFLMMTTQSDLLGIADDLTYRSCKLLAIHLSSPVR